MSTICFTTTPILKICGSILDPDSIEYYFKLKDMFKCIYKERKCKYKHPFAMMLKETVINNKYLLDGGINETSILTKSFEFDFKKF